MRVEVGLASHEVVLREQHLTHRHAAFRERALVRVHQDALPDARGRLQRRDVVRLALQRERIEARRDRAARNQNALQPLAPQRADLPRKGAHLLVVEPPVLAGEARRTDLHDDPSHVRKRARHGCSPATCSGVNSNAMSPMRTSSPSRAPARDNASSMPSAMSFSWRNASASALPRS